MTTQLSAVLHKREYDPEAAERARARLAAQNELCPGCATCGGSGFVAQSGKMSVCPTRQARLLRSGLPEYGLTADEINGLNWQFSRSHNIAGKVAVSIRKMDAGQVFLWGDPGRGKTLILQNVAAQALRDGRRACYITLSRLLQELRETYDPQISEQLSDRLAWYRAIPVLCLDEIDKPDMDKSWVQEHTGQLLDERWRQARQGESLTVISSNKPPRALPDYMASRIHDNRGVVFEMTGEDARPKMPKEWKW